jgi:hypothetical protein
MNDPFTDIQASLFAFCKTFADDMRLADVTDMDLVKWDAHADIEELPEKDVIGPMGLTLDIRGGLVSGTAAIGIATLNDTNSFRLDAALGRLLNRLLPDSSIYLLDAITGAVYGNIKLKDLVQVLPPERTKTRAARAIAFEFVSDHAHESSQ